MSSADSWARWKGDGDWTEDPWFLGADGGWEPEWNALGLPLEKREIAAKALRKVFPPEICRAIREGSFDRYGPVLGLFGVVRTPGLVAHLLDLGLDASLAKPWEDPALLHRLHWRNMHDEAAFEVRVQAALLRAGFDAQRVPETPEEKRRDLDVRKEGASYEVEVKLVNEPDLNEVAKDLQHVFSTSELVVPGLHLELRGSDALAEQALDATRLPSLQGQLREVVREFSECADRIRSAPAPGRYVAGEVGHIIAIPGPQHGSFTNLTLPELSEEKKASRVVRRMRDGLDQLTGNDTGVLVVGVFHAAHPFLVERQAQLRAKSDDRWKKCRMVVLVDNFPPPPDLGVSDMQIPVTHAFSPHIYRSLRPREIELALAAGGTHQRSAFPIGSPRSGHFAITMNTRRSPVTVRSSGRISLEAGASVQISIDGFGNTRVEHLPPESLP